MVETPGDARLEQLERRVRNDPASVAFAALAEEYRRAGRLEEAIETCRAGLTRHPAYLSARVTLGRALMETGALEEAEAELQRVVTAAPENLAAIRCLADLHHRRGDDHEPDTPLASPPASPPGPSVEAPAPSVEVPGPSVEVPAPSVEVPGPSVEVPAPSVEMPAPPVEPPAAEAPPVAAAPAEPTPAYGEMAPEALAAPDAAEPAPEPEPDDPVIADLEEFLACVVSAREARDGPASR